MMLNCTIWHEGGALHISFDILDEQSRSFDIRYAI